MTDECQTFKQGHEYPVQPISLRIALQSHCLLGSGVVVKQLCTYFRLSYRVTCHCSVHEYRSSEPSFLQNGVSQLLCVFRLNCLNVFLFLYRCIRGCLRIATGRQTRAGVLLSARSPVGWHSPLTPLLFSPEPHCAHAKPDVT